MTISIISICVAAVLITLIVNIKEYIIDKERRQKEESVASLREDNEAYRQLYHSMRAIFKDSHLVVTKEQKEQLNKIFDDAERI